MIIRKSERELDNLRVAGKIVKGALEEVEKFIKVGVSTKALDDVVYKYITSNGATPSFLGLYDFPGSACISVNDEIVHGIPSNKVILKDGDIVTIDAGACYQGMNADGAWTFCVGDVAQETKLLLQRTKDCLDEVVKIVKPGMHVGEIGDFIDNYLLPFDYAIYEEICGHGIGASVHEDPQVLNYSIGSKGPMLKPGTVICIEPMIGLGTEEMYEKDDEWTLATKDGSMSCHFEYTVIVTETGYEVVN